MLNLPGKWKRIKAALMLKLRVLLPPETLEPGFSASTTPGVNEISYLDEKFVKRHSGKFLAAALKVISGYMPSCFA